MRTFYIAYRYQLSPTNRRATLDRNDDSQIADLTLRSEGLLATGSYASARFSRLELQQLMDMLTDALQDWPA